MLGPSRLPRFNPFKPEFTIHFHPLQAANCGRTSRFVVDENDMKWEAKKENIMLFLKKSFMKTVVLKPLDVGIKSFSRTGQNPNIMPGTYRVPRFQHIIKVQN